MSDLYKELEKLAVDLELERLQLSERDRAAFAIEKHKAETMRREVEARERDEANYPERCRAQRHHEVLCLVLKELVQARLSSATMLDEMIERYLPAHKQIAVAYADAHYPPPKSTTDELRAAGFVPHGRDPLTGAPLPPKAGLPAWDQSDGVGECPIHIGVPATDCQCAPLPPKEQP